MSPYSEHPMAQQWMEWRPIDTAPDDGEQILVGFMGQFKWFSYVAEAYGKNTGQHMPALPTHWTKIDPPTW